jgi:Ran GTPase-activating protein (RanGAP) involved in mRNA processing and transport
VLQLGFNSIGKAGAEALAEAHAGGFIDRLEHLDLACNVLGPAGLEALARMLEPRDATESGALDEGGEGAGGLDAGGGLEEEGEEEEGPCASEMYASDEEVSDDGEASSEKAPRATTRARCRVRARPTIGLLSLDVAVNNVALDGDRSGVRALTRVLETNRTLRALNMRGNDLTPEMAGDVAECLLENATLEVVNVGYNKIYNDGAWELAEALSENTSLRGLDIQRNEITDKGAAHVAALLSANAGLDEVDMRSNMLSPELVEAFGGRFGDRVNCRWQQEPPKAEEREVGVARKAKVASEGGGAVAAKRAERERRKAERLAKRGR